MTIALPGGIMEKRRADAPDEGEIAMEITKKTTMGEMLCYDRGIAMILMQNGMHCVGCPAHAMESLEDGCAVHGLDADLVLAQIKEYLASKA